MEHVCVCECVCEDVEGSGEGDLGGIESGGLDAPEVRQSWERQGELPR